MMGLGRLMISIKKWPQKGKKGEKTRKTGSSQKATGDFQSCLCLLCVFAASYLLVHFLKFDLQFLGSFGGLSIRIPLRRITSITHAFRPLSDRVTNRLAHTLLIAPQTL